MHEEIAGILPIRVVRSRVWVVAIFLACAGAAEIHGQAGATTNPLAGNADAVRDGNAIYEARCAACHGAGARGDAGGCDLTELWSEGGADQPLFQTIRRGFPNTLKPHSFGPDREVWAILAYLSTLDVGPEQMLSSNDAASGERLFWTECGVCHSVNGRGGQVGPDLSRVGSRRSPAALAHKIRHASSYIASIYEGGYVTEGYEPVTLVISSGHRIRAVKKNEDAFSIQIMDASGRIRGYRKDDLEYFHSDDSSLMPDFGPDRLPDADLKNLVAYLATLRVEPRTGSE
jgi:putative heme-binding domain-containing protein